MTTGDIAAHGVAADHDHGPARSSPTCFGHANCSLACLFVYLFAHRLAYQRLAPPNRMDTTAMQLGTCYFTRCAYTLTQSGG